MEIIINTNTLTVSQYSDLLMAFHNAEAEYHADPNNKKLLNEYHDLYRQLQQAKEARREQIIKELMP